MDNPGILLVLWLLIAPVVGALILSALGSRADDRHTGTRL
jgi:hypothetical protein